MKWLCSPNTEKQIYAIEGLHQLFKEGMKLNQQEMKMIEFVINKKGTLNVCGGCLFSIAEISSIASRFKFENK